MARDDRHPAQSPLPGPDEPPAVEVVNPAGLGSVVLLCDHASHRVPRRLGILGLDPRQLSGHIGWDPGAAEVARRLSRQLDAPLVLSGYSRLVIDCNRPPSSVESIAEQSAGVPIPGNRHLPASERALRIRGLFEPYHQAISRLLDERRDRPTVLLSIHSFSPNLQGLYRPWSVGIAYGRDHRLAELLLAALARDSEIVVGDNDPYRIEPRIDYSLPLHGEGRGLPHAMIEIRQDSVRTTAGAARWAARLEEAYRRIEAAFLPPLLSCEPSDSVH
ncbi:N-formylglutamate amidohydrolase [Endothiovibrio diazotrophicus]